MDKNNIFQKIIIPKKWGDNKSQEILDTLNNISGKDILTIWEELKTKEDEKKKLEEEWIKRDKEKLKESQFDKLHWNFFAILDDLKFNHVSKFEWCIGWESWRSVNIKFPAIWEFEWYKFSYFTSNKEVRKTYFDAIPEIDWYLYTIKDIANILNVIRDYLKEYWVVIDKNIDYEKELKPWKNILEGCEAWIFFKKLTWFNKIYWLKDDNLGVFKKSRAYLDCKDIGINVDCYYLDWTYANLLLKR